MRRHLWILLLLGGYGLTAHADLIHRYDCNGAGTVLADRAGTAHGTLRGGAVQADGVVRLDGQGAFVELPVDSFGLSALSAVTFELWVTQPTRNQGYTMTLAVGGTWPNGFGRDYLMLCTSRGDNVSRAALALTSDQSAPWSDELGVNGPELNDGQRHCYIVTIGNGQLSYSLDGEPLGTVAVPADALGRIAEEAAFLGKSVYTGDATVELTLDEFRVYDQVLSPEQIRDRFTQGPDAVWINRAASQPFPPHGAEHVPVNVTLSWKRPGSAPSPATVLLSRWPDLHDAESVTLADANQWPVSLQHDTTYFWQVTLEARGQTVPGPLWSFTTVKQPLEAAPLGDLDGDFRVDWKDLDRLAAQWLQAGSCAGIGCADLDGGGRVDFRDLAWQAGQWGRVFERVVINEIHYHPPENTRPLEFVELLNPSTVDQDLSGWRLEDAVAYRFAPGTVLPAGQAFVVSQDPNALWEDFGVPSYGPFEGKLSNEGERLVLRDAAGRVVDEVDYGPGFPWPVVADGEGASIELLWPLLDNDLGGSWRSSGLHDDRPSRAFGDPTPGRLNSVMTAAVGPAIRQVRHRPEQPAADQAVTVTAKVTDADGVSSVTLWVQTVAPGRYLPAWLPLSKAELLANPYRDPPANPAFEDPVNWTAWPMVDDGTAGDAVAGDDRYTVVLPGMENRTLLRYRVEAVDGRGHRVRVPFADDPSLNFAAFVYDGVPDYVATEDSVTADGPGHVHPAETLTSLPVITLVTREEDFYQCCGYDPADRLDQGSSLVMVQDAGRAYNWEGALVYDGQVYDHIGYRLRGGNGRYNYNQFAGKRSMKFRFNRGRYFHGHDLFGEPFPSGWQHLNTSKMFGNQILFANYNRYPYGLNELIDMRLFEAAGVPAPATWWIHFRVVQRPDEAPSGLRGQYLGDFYGLYLAFENYDGAFLERLGLPKGNLYKLSDKVYDGPRQLRYQGPNAVTDASDYENIRWNLDHTASAQFIQDFVDCDEWYRYHTVTEAIRHYDIFSGPTCVHCLKNSAWYFYPDYSVSPFGKLQLLPFDVDDTWGPYFNQGVDHVKAAIYDQRYTGGLEQFPVDPEKAPLRQAYRNVIREFRDLHWQPEVIDGMIDELAAVIRDFVPADRDRWRLDDTVPGRPMDNGPLAECVALMKQFAWRSGSFPGGFYWVGSAAHLDSLAGQESDTEQIPETPTVTYLGDPGYPVNDLWFGVTAFRDPQGDDTFAALQWRIGLYELNHRPEDTSSVLVGAGDTWRYAKGLSEPPTGWRQVDFDDGAWALGQTPIGYGDGDDRTDLSLDDPPMRNQYSSVYLRHAFEVNDINQIEQLDLGVYVDDGCIVWINGVEVARPYCGAGVKTHDSLTDVTHHEATGYETVTVAAPRGLLRSGRNVVAVHALQATLGSSDFSIDVTLTARRPPAAPGPLRPSYYELRPVWQGPEQTDPDDRVRRIPAGPLDVGRTYRVRCRMKDQSGRWSHWSDPVEFVTGPAVASALRQGLRLTELMYHPAAGPRDRFDGEDYEFIELANVDPVRTLDLRGLALDEGVQFRFADADIGRLEPGRRVLVVRNAEALVERYGAWIAGSIAGQYQGALRNSGERLVLTDREEGVLLDFTYGDDPPWPTAPDGDGLSLVPLDGLNWESIDAGVLNDASVWRAAVPTPGT